MGAGAKGERELGDRGGDWVRWRQAAPAGLRRQNPLAVLGVLELCAAAEGIFQVELQAATGAGQSWLSKLVKKLEEAGWVTVSHRAGERGRSRIQTTAAGRSVLSRFRSRRPAAPAPVGPARKPRVIRKQIGQLGFDLGGEQTEPRKPDA